MAHTWHSGDGDRKRHVHDAILEQFRHQCNHDSRACFSFHSILLNTFSLAYNPIAQFQKIFLIEKIEKQNQLSRFFNFFFCNIFIFNAKVLSFIIELKNNNINNKR